MLENLGSLSIWRKFPVWISWNFQGEWNSIFRNFWERDEARMVNSNISGISSREPPKFSIEWHFWYSTIFGFSGNFPKQLSYHFEISGVFWLNEKRFDANGTRGFPGSSGKRRYISPLEIFGNANWSNGKLCCWAFAKALQRAWAQIRQFFPLSFGRGVNNYK